MCLQPHPFPRSNKTFTWCCYTRLQQDLKLNVISMLIAVVYGGMPEILQIRWVLASKCRKIFFFKIEILGPARGKAAARQECVAELLELPNFVPCGHCTCHSFFGVFKFQKLHAQVLHPACIKQCIPVLGHCERHSNSMQCLP